jgi:DNA-binding IscR family transcriptional regulator
VVRPLWLELQEEMMHRLDALTLDDLCSRAHQSGIAGRASQYTDFEI